MKFLWKLVRLCLIIGFVLWCFSLVSDRISLSENVVRFHVVANSDSEADQALKLQVRDAVVEQLQSIMKSLPSAQEAKEYILSHMDEIKELANQVLASAGSTAKAVVSLQKEAFGLREYDTFTLPAGVYDALRITIGEGKGHNWWCVVFPTLCAGATSDDFADTAVGAGFHTGLTGALKQEKGYEVRFYFLDLLGRMQNYLFGK